MPRSNAIDNDLSSASFMRFEKNCSSSSASSEFSETGGMNSARICGLPMPITNCSLDSTSSSGTNSSKNSDFLQKLHRTDQLNINALPISYHSCWLFVCSLFATSNGVCCCGGVGCFPVLCSCCTSDSLRQTAPDLRAVRCPDRRE